MAQQAISLPGGDLPAGGAPFQPESLLGTVVAGRYRISGHLASGGMAAVYIAEDTAARRDVALKVLRPDLESSPESVRQFLCEGSIASLIEHENVVRVLDHGGDADGPHFIAMELLEGEGLFDRLRRRGALPPSEAVAVLLQVCAGLEAAHRQGIVHRDLKPENVFLHGQAGSAPLVKLLDFGVARAANVEAGDRGLVVGTPEYLSPEQAFGQDVDARSDVYSVGIMAWRMLAGRTPFSAESANSMIRKQAREPVPPLTDARPDLAAHHDLVAAVARACSKDPDLRPQSASAFADELARSVGHATPLPSPVPEFPAQESAGEAPVRTPERAPERTAAAPRIFSPPAPAPAPRPAAGPGPGSALRLAAAGALVAGLAVAAASLYVHYRPMPRAERLVAQGRHPEARDVLATAVASRPEDARLRAHLGRVLFRLGQTAEALDSYDVAARENPAVLEGADLDAMAGALVRRGKDAQRASRLLLQAGPAALPAVLAALPRTSGAERVRALELAHAIDPAQPVDPVAAWGPLLEDPDCDVRRAAAVRLGASHDPAAIPRLEALAGLREGRPPPGVTPGREAPAVCGATEAGEAVARLRSEAPPR